MTTLDRIPAVIREEDAVYWRQLLSHHGEPQLQRPILVAITVARG